MSALLRAKARKAVTALQEGRAQEARDLYEQVCRAAPRDLAAWFNLGAAYGQLGDFAEAERCFRRALDLRPDWAQAHQHLGEALELQGRTRDPLQCYEHVSRLAPAWDAPHFARGRLLEREGDIEASIAAYMEALRRNAAHVEAALRAGALLHRSGRAERAVPCYLQVLQSHPHHGAAYHQLAGAYLALGRLDEALQCFRRARSLAPDLIDAVAGEAEVLERLGRAEEAGRVLAPALMHEPASLHALLVQGRLSARTGGRAEAIAALERFLVDEARSLSAWERERAHFMLGELYDATGDLERAFGHYRQGNALHPAHFDPARQRAAIDALIAAFRPDFMRHAPRASRSDARPVFIVGMPRSGTSLVEAILASHPQVYGAGELPVVGELAASLPRLLEGPYPQAISAITQSHSDALAARYLDALAAMAPEAQRVTDKMPHNFLHLGLIDLLFPGARVIHCVRDAFDTCLSCYFQHFGGVHAYAYDLGHLGRYYREYERLMAHWRTVLRLPLFELSYERLAAEPETAIRDLIRFCDLPWDERCLRHTDTQRITVTASYEQVRRPVHQDRVGRWRRYERFLEPLKSALNS